MARERAGKTARARGLGVLAACGCLVLALGIGLTMRLTAASSTPPHSDLPGKVTGSAPAGCSIGGLGGSGNLSGCPWANGPAPGPSGSAGPGTRAGSQEATSGPCDQACQQEQLVLRNENTVVPKPSETPAITQQQLDQRRESAEASDSPVTASTAPSTPSPSPDPAP
ncbi:MAG TPA: hypothetical protein VGI58_19765 [Streptosporangiaceae bacterium]